MILMRLEPHEWNRSRTAASIGCEAEPHGGRRAASRLQEGDHRGLSSW